MRKFCLAFQVSKSRKKSSFECVAFDALIIDQFLSDFDRVKSDFSFRPSTLTYPREIFDRTAPLERRIASRSTAAFTPTKSYQFLLSTSSKATIWTSQLRLRTSNHETWNEGRGFLLWSSNLQQQGYACQIKTKKCSFVSGAPPGWDFLDVTRPQTRTFFNSLCNIVKLLTMVTYGRVFHVLKLSSTLLLWPRNLSTIISLYIFLKNIFAATHRRFIILVTRCVGNKALSSFWSYGCRCTWGALRSGIVEGDSLRDLWNFWKNVFDIPNNSAGSFINMQFLAEFTLFLSNFPKEILSPYNDGPESMYL